MNTDLKKAIELLERVARARKPRLIHGKIIFSIGDGRVANWCFQSNHRRKDLEDELKNKEKDDSK